MQAYFTPLIRGTAALNVVANTVALGLQAAAGGSAVAGVALAAGVAAIGPLLIVLTGAKANTLVLAAFVVALLGDAVGLGIGDVTQPASAMLFFGLVVSLLACVAATLVQAQTSLEKPRNRL